MFSKWEQKHRAPDTYYINNNYGNVVRSMKIKFNLTRAGRKHKKHRKAKKLVFLKNQYKPVLNKIITTLE